MTLESELQELNTNVKNLTDAVLGMFAAVNAMAGKPAAVAVPTKAPADRDTEAPTPKPKATKAAPPAEPAGPSFDDVKKALLKVINKNRDAGVELLAALGVKKVTEIAVEDYAKAIETAAKWPV